MGIETVAVYSEFDRDAVHVREADVSVAVDSYLNIEAVLDAAKRSGADSIHPGYGFLAENADFASACEDTGVVFIGPRPEVIRALGSKLEARQIAEKAGVAVVPAPVPDEFPVLIKASAGGGGRGMRVVREAGELAPALESARGEARRAFGDDTLLVEKYIEGARHIEIQVFGDHHGGLMHLYERDCSMQRRFQKIIEESPAPNLDAIVRDRMTDAALRIAEALGYTNAGTMEFLLAPSGEFYFIEANTRIQVEHPVTEMITGLDLVQLQLEIAMGRPLPSRPEPSGHAIEARLYAEDPDNAFLPAAGIVHVWRPPSDVRIDTAIERGAEIGVHYDSLLAKVIAHGPDRETAVRKLAYALRTFVAQGVTTNREFLMKLLDEREAPAPDDEQLAAIVCAHIERTEHAHRAILPSVPIGYRNNPYPRPPMKFAIGAREYAVRPGDPMIDSVRHQFHIQRHGDEYYVHSRLMQRTVRRLTRYPHATGTPEHETANSPMPGKVLRILVAAGQRVRAGEALVVLEAMKMEQTVKTTIQGLVRAVLVKEGEIVAPGQMLVEIESGTEEETIEHDSDSAAANN